MEKVKLETMGRFFRENINPRAGWITLDYNGVQIFTASAANPEKSRPVYDRERDEWKAAPGTTLLARIEINKKYIYLRDYIPRRNGDIEFSIAIERIYNRENKVNGLVNDNARDNAAEAGPDPSAATAAQTTQTAAPPAAPGTTTGLVPANAKKVIAWLEDGCTVIFDSKSEARDFLGLERIEQVNYYIESGCTLPDGKTTIDEALTQEPTAARRTQQ